MEQSYNVIVNNGGMFDLQSALGKMLWFICSKYKYEHHYPGYSYFGPQTALKIRLDENNQPKVWEEPVSPTDQLALHHDIALWDAEKQDPKIALQIKH